MNSKEIVRAAFRKQPTDKVPVNHRGFSGRIGEFIMGRPAFVGGSILRWRQATALWEGWYDEFVEQEFTDACEIAMLTHQDLIRASYWGGQTCKPTQKPDEFTYLYEYGDQKDWQVMRYNPEVEQANMLPYEQRQISLDELRQRVADMEQAVESYQPTEKIYAPQLKAMQLYGDDYAVEAPGVSVGIPHEAMSTWFHAMVSAKDLVHRLIAVQVETARKNIEFLTARSLYYLTGGTDFCSEQGPMYSPAMFAEFVLPGLKEICRICHEHNAYYMFASDGNLWPVGEFVFGESGVDAYFEIDRKAGMDLPGLRKTYPNLTLVGNISSWTLARGTKEEVKQEVILSCRAAKKYNGIIVGVSNAIQPETPFENVETLLETLEDNR